MRHPLLALALILVAMVAAGCGGGDDAKPGATGGDKAPLRKVTLLLNWFPEHEHGGFFAAQLNGYYAEEGLEVEIQPGGPQMPVVQRVASGQVTFGVTNADQVIFGRAASAAVVSVMAPIQVSPRCLIVHEESGITRFEDLRNMTIAMNSNDGFAAHLMKKFPLEGVKVVRYSGNLAAFLRDKNMAQQAYVFSEPIIAREQGATVRELMVAETGYNPYTSLLIVREALIESDPDLVHRMTRASIRGWQSYIQSPEKTNAHIQTLFPELTESILREGVKKLIPLVVPDGMAPERLGEQTRERWAELVATMEDSGQVEAGRVSPAACFTDRFVK